MFFCYLCHTGNIMNMTAENRVIRACFNSIVMGMTITESCISSNVMSMAHSTLCFRSFTSKIMSVPICKRSYSRIIMHVIHRYSPLIKLLVTYYENKHIYVTLQVSSRHSTIQFILLLA
jgi:hypothetical protein